MRLAMVGLGKMGGNMSRRLIRAGHQVVGYNHSPAAAERLAAEAGLIPAFTLEDAVQARKQAPDTTAVIWLMIPAGLPTEEAIRKLKNLLSPGDIVIDGGNSNYHDSMRRAGVLRESGIHFLDVGVSGGIWGLAQGYSLMVGGDAEVMEVVRPAFEALAPAPDQGWGHVGPNGAGHFVKMIHNGIEYGLMEAYAEGFELLHAKEEYDLDLHQIAEIWRTGSVVRSWLLDLTARALEADPDLSNIRGWVADSGEGRWTVIEAIENDVPAPVIALSLFRRFASRQEESFSAKLLAAMRNQFGGHAVKSEPTV